MKEELIEEVKNLLKIKNEPVEINKKYLDFLDEEELLNIKQELEYKKNNLSDLNRDFLDEIYNKTKNNNV